MRALSDLRTLKTYYEGGSGRKGTSPATRQKFMVVISLG